MSDTTSTFDRALRQVLQTEGGFTNDPLDSGGATNYGITEETARAAGYIGPMQRMSLDLAKQIYRSQYWNAMQLDAIVRAGCPDLAVELFCSGVNVGTRPAGRWLQRSLNVLNDRERHYKDLVEDGAIGMRTLTALNSLIKLRGHDAQTVLIRAVDGLQTAFYISLAERRQKDERFVFGWLKHRTH